MSLSSGESNASETPSFLWVGHMLVELIHVLAVFFFVEACVNTVLGRPKLNI